MTRRKPPHGVSVLQRWITEAERASGVAAARQQRWVSFMVLAAMLERVRADDGDPLCMIKGGVDPLAGARLAAIPERYRSGTLGAQSPRGRSCEDVRGLPTSAVP